MYLIHKTLKHSIFVVFRMLCFTFTDTKTFGTKSIFLFYLKFFIYIN